MSVGHLIIPENDVLIATVVFLKEWGVTCYGISDAREKGTDKKASETSAWAALGDDIPHIHPFSAQGADVIGISATEWWNVECKGSGTGVSQTQRNNFGFSSKKVGKQQGLFWSDSFGFNALRQRHVSGIMSLLLVRTGQRRQASRASR